MVIPDETKVKRKLLISFKAPRQSIAECDELVRIGRYLSRSDLLRCAVRDLLTEERRAKTLGFPNIELTDAEDAQLKRSLLRIRENAIADQKLIKKIWEEASEEKKENKTLSPKDITLE